MPWGGGGRGVGAYPIAIRGDGTQAIYATTGARDTYYANPANADELNALDGADVAVAIGTAGALTAAYVYRSAETPQWQLIATNFEGEAGVNGWSPSYSLETDGERRVLRVVDWTGGSGSKPATGKYIGALGLVDLIADAVDVRGTAGAKGDAGANGAQGQKGDAGANGTNGTNGIGIQNMTASEANNIVTVTVTRTDNSTIQFQYPVAGGVMPTNDYRAFSQSTATVTQQIIEAVPDFGTELPYRKFLTSPQQYLIVAWHSTTEVTDIHVNILESDAVLNDITSSPLGNRFQRSLVQTIGIYEYIALDIDADINLLTGGQKIGIYVG